jgi:methionine biosynthesis protein MetW
MTSIRSTPVEACPVCGGSGPLLYQGLRDREFDAPGEWSIRRCADCRSLWLDPRPTDDDLHLAYATYFTHAKSPATTKTGAKSALARTCRVIRDAGADSYIATQYGYAKSTSAWAPLAEMLIRVWPGRRLDAEFKVMRLPFRSPATMLDVGCGDGELLESLRERGWAVRGVDFDPDAVAAARSQGLDVDLGDLRAQCYPDAAFDAVTMSHSLEHVPEPRAILEEVRRILKPGGRIVIVTPNARSWLHRRYGSDWKPLEPPRHLQIFAMTPLTSLVREVGFVDVESTTTARSANGMARAAWKLRRDGRWDPASRPSLPERILMEAMQQMEALKLRTDPEAGEELVIAGMRSG